MKSDLKPHEIVPQETAWRLQAMREDIMIAAEADPERLADPEWLEPDLRAVRFATNIRDHHERLADAEAGKGCHASARDHEHYAAALDQIILYHLLTLAEVIGYDLGIRKPIPASPRQLSLVP
jgi:hypothetical protein